MNRISKHVLVTIAVIFIALPDSQAGGADNFSEANWSSTGNFRNDGPLPRPVGGVGAAATDASGNLYVGGEFTIVGGVFATNIAKWNGSTWSALGSGLNGGVGALLTVGNELYAGGQFTRAGGVPATNIARWNGSHWSALGSGLSSLPSHPGYVSSLVRSSGDLYAGGYFTNAGGLSANFVARWNGSNWSALGSGVGYVVQALVVSGDNLYAGGHFTTAGGLLANYVARWNGASWSALGSGMNDPVYSLALLGNDLYAGGYFETAGGVSATNIARWDGSTWSAVGPGIRPLDPYSFHLGNVTALVVSGNDLFVAGNFNYGEDWDEVNRIARWNGSSWNALGSERNAFVATLAVSGANLYAGMSDDSSGHIFKARIGSTVEVVAATTSPVSLQFSGVTGYDYDLQRTTSLNPPLFWTTLNTNPLMPAADGSFMFTDTNATSGSAFYRLHKR